MTTDDDGPVLRRYGWCSPHDQYHNLCRKTMRSVFGVESKCDCPGHVDEDNVPGGDPEGRVTYPNHANDVDNDSGE